MKVLSELLHVHGKLATHIQFPFLLRHISLLSLVSHLIFPFPRLPLLYSVFFSESWFKPSMNTGALEHEVEKDISGCSASKSQIHIQHFQQIHFHKKRASQPVLDLFKVGQITRTGFTTGYRIRGNSTTAPRREKKSL